MGYRDGPVRLRLAEPLEYGLRQMGKALFFIPTAKTPMPAVWNWINQTDYVDKLILQNFQKGVASEIAMQFFFQQDEYDYLIVTTDDVLGHQFQVRHLLDVEEEHRFPILSGWCNHVDLWASLRVEPLETEFLEKALNRPFPGMVFEEYDFTLSRDVVTGSFGFPFFKVWFTGIPLTLIQKEALKRVPFREWRRCKDDYCITPQAKEEGRGVMFDLQWAIDCAEKKIPITIDARVFLLHVFKTRSGMQVGQKPPSVHFFPAVDEPRSPEELAEIDGLLREISASAWEERKLTRKTEFAGELEGTLGDTPYRGRTSSRPYRRRI